MTLSLQDTWANLTYKARMRAGQNEQKSVMAPTWAGHHQRRLLAYSLLSSYVTNTSRLFRSQHFAHGTVRDINNFDPVIRYRAMGVVNTEDQREYGDANLLVQMTLAALLGDKQTIVVPGAAEQKDETQNSDTPANKDALACENYLRLWWRNEMMQLNLLEAEEDAVTFGDGVYVFGWDEQKHRARCRVYDPGAYFPVLDPEADEDFPKRVHIAYEYETDIDDREVSEETNRIRRITYEIGEDGFCYMTDATWMANATGTSYTPGPGGTKNSVATVDRFDLAAAKVIRKNRMNMGFKKIPVVHVPNTVAGAAHYGISSLSMVGQILDDMQSVDTDLQKAAATTGTPMITLVGSRVKAADRDKGVKVGPGTFIELELGGDMVVLDTSKSLDALLKLSEALAKRFSANSRLPEALLGKTDAEKAPSGLAIALTFGPLNSMISVMRLVRAWKYSLMLKLVLEMAMAAKAAGDKDKSMVELPDNLDSLIELPHLEFGNFLPTDLSETVKNVFELINAKAISIEVGLKMLQSAGLPIVSVKDEALRLQHADFEAASKLFTASGGDVAAVGTFLGLTLTRFVEPTPAVAPSGGFGK